MKKLIFVLLLIMALITGCSSNSPTDTVSYNDLYGTIYTEEFGSPIKGAEVTIAGKTATTDSEGKYFLTDIKSGNYIWEVTSSKYQDFSYEVNIKSDSKIDQSLALSGGTASVNGSITLHNDTGYTMTQSTSKEESRSVPLNTSEYKRKYKKGEVIAKYKNTLSSQSINNLQAEQNLKKLNSLKSQKGKIVRYKIQAGKTVEEMVSYYNDLPEVEFAEPNYIVYQLSIPSDTYYDDQWGFINLNMEAAWDQRKTSDLVTIAVIDSGIVPNHPDLQNNLIQGADFVGGDQTDDPSNYNVTDLDPTDESTDSSHGTHVAGIIGAVGDNNKGVTGVNWNTNILPIRVFDADGIGYTWDVAEGIYYAVNRGAEVINMSLGGPDSNLEYTAIKDAYNSDIVIIAAAGNGGSDGMSYPAGYDETIAVGATDINNVRADYSNHGPKLDLVAPGGSYYNRIYSTCGYYDGYNTIPTYEYMMGTSMATPYVSGIAALLIADGVSPRDVRYRLTSTTVDLGSSGKDNYYGYGLVDAYGALMNKRLRKPYVFATNQKNGNIYVKSEMIRINDDGSYNLNKVVAEEVYIVGWRDVNENQKIDAGDYYGEYSSTINVSENSQYAASFNMSYVTEASGTSMEVKGIPEVETK